MNVGVLRLELAVFEALNLKDKRRVIKSIKDRVRARFNVSVAEVDHLDSRQRATLAVAMVSNDAGYLHGGLDRIVEFVRSGGKATLVDFEKQVF